VILLGFSLVIGTLIMEQGYRFYLYGTASFSYEKVNSVRDIGRSDLIQASEFPEVVYELKPNLSSVFKLEALNTNSHGLRDKEYSLEKAEGTIRVAVVGDSFTMPSGVSIEDAYHSRVEERLNAEQTGMKYEFINFGVGGYSFAQYLAVLKNKAVHFSPDAVLVGFCPCNDHQLPPPAPPQGYDFEATVEKGVFYNFYSVRKLRYEVLPFVLNKLRGTQVQETELREDDRKVFTDQEQAYLDSTFLGLSNFREESGIPIVVAYLQYEQDEIYKKHLLEYVHKHQFHFVDLSARFPQDDLIQYRIFVTDGHPDAEANAIFAETLYDYFQDAQVLVPRNALPGSSP